MYEVSSGKKRIKEFDLLRTFCAIVIILYHFSVHIGGGYSFLWLGNTNAKWGLVAVTVFFMLSGCLLYYNHDEVHKDEVKEFYKKRWKQIFPEQALSAQG